MSELKAFDITVAEEYYYEGVVKYRRAVYDKSEADKVIAHSNYKRCMAMAKWCRSRACFYDTMREGSLYWAWKSDKAYKWHKRWLKIAEQFKEADK